MAGTTSYRALHLGNCLKDLQPLYEVNLNKKTPKAVCRSLPVMFDQARLAMNDKDEEKAYVLFMRLLACMGWLRKTDEYRKDKNFIKKYVTVSQVEEILKTVEELAERLEKRYMIEKPQEKIVQTVKSQKNTPNNTVQETPVLPETPTDDPLDTKAEECVTCDQLFQQIQKPDAKILIIDVRSHDEYITSRINCDKCINIPSNKIKLGMIPRDFNECLQEQDQRSFDLFSHRGERYVDLIILLDWSSNLGSLNPVSPINILKTILLKWDPGVTYKKIVILEGGFGEWLTRYPVLATNPLVTPPNTNQNSVDKILDDVEYPDYMFYSSEDEELNKIQKNQQVEISTPKKQPVYVPPKEKPVRPAKPVELSQPSKPVQSVKPVQPVQPVKPVQPVQPVKPVQPDQPVKAITPDRPITPVRPIQPPRPVQPTNTTIKPRLEDTPKKQRGEIPSSKADTKSDIHKEALKQDGQPTSSNLKRSYSSPNLAKLDDHNGPVQWRLDGKVPLIDRSSKPQKPQQHRNQSANTSNTKNRQFSMSSRDRELRMNPVFGMVNPGVTGLKNLGNSCYMNSIVQCLSNTAYLAKYFIDGSYASDLNASDRNNGTSGQVVEEFAQVIRALWRGHYRSISPRDLKIAVGQYKLQFETYEQQDSQEFLTFLLDWMHDDLKTNDKLITDNPLSNAEKEWNKAMDGQRSVISQLFFGQLQSTVHCSICGKSSTTYQTFNTLTVSLPPSVRCTLDDRIRIYLGEQKVSGWKCPSCKAARDAVKKFDFAKLAPIVVVHLNRFGDSGGWLEKKNTSVEFPLTGLDLKQYLVGDSGTTEVNSAQQHYSLYAVSNHYGTMEGGHYTAYCKSETQNKWYKYDDHTVTEVSPGVVKSQTTNAYLLFYTSLLNPS